MDHLHRRDLVIHAAVAQIDDGRRGLHADVLQQHCGLLELRGHGVAVVRVAGKLRAPTIRPCLCVTAKLTWQPIS
jgi:hypothetical protein